MAPEPKPFIAGQQGQSVYGMPPGSRPRRSRLFLVGVLVVAVFTAFAAIVWIAHDRGSGGSPVGEPPLIRADTSPIKLWRRAGLVVPRASWPGDRARAAATAG